MKVGPEREGGKAHTSRVFPRAKKRETFVPDGSQGGGGGGVREDMLVSVSRYLLAPRTSPLDYKLR